MTNITEKDFPEIRIEDAKDIGSRIHAARVFYNMYRTVRIMSRQTLADKLGISKYWLAKIEHGEKCPTKEEILTAAVVLNKTVEYFLYGDLTGITEYADYKREET